MRINLSEWSPSSQEVLLFTEPELAVTSGANVIIDGTNTVYDNERVSTMSRLNLALRWIMKVIAQF